MEQKLSNRIVKEPSAFDKTIEKTDKIIRTYKKVDEVYSTVSNSAIGKTLAKKLGLDIEPKKKAWDWDKVKKNLDKMSNEEISDAAKRKKNEDTILGKNKDDDNQNKDDGNQNQNKNKNNGNQNQNQNKNDSNNQNSNSNNDQDKNAGKKDRTDEESYSGTVEGQGTSRRQSDSTYTRSRRDDIINDDSLWEVVDDTPISNYPATRTSTAESVVRGLLETRRKLQNGIQSNRL